MHEAYVEARIFKRFYAFAGKKEYTQGSPDHRYSLGAFTVSGNAPTLPMLYAGMPEFWNVPGTNGFIGLRGDFAHGWLGNDRFAEGAFLHSKSAWLKLFPDRWPLQLAGGLIHNVQWGGRSPRFGRLPSGLDDYLRVIFGQSSDGNIENETDGTLGNTVSAYDYYLTTAFWGRKIKAYRITPIETRVALLFRSPWDAMWGIKIEDEKPGSVLQVLVYDYVNYTRQNAKQLDDVSNQMVPTSTTRIRYIALAGPLKAGF